MSIDPWRYRCIECGSTQLEHRQNTENKTLNGNVAAGEYYCNECGNSADKRLDVKTGKKVA